MSKVLVSIGLFLVLLPSIFVSVMATANQVHAVENCAIIDCYAELDIMSQIPAKLNWTKPNLGFIQIDTNSSWSPWLDR